MLRDNKLRLSREHAVQSRDRVVHKTARIVLFSAPPRAPHVQVDKLGQMRQKLGASRLDAAFLNLRDERLPIAPFLQAAQLLGRYDDGRLLGLPPGVREALRRCELLG